MANVQFDLSVMMKTWWTCFQKIIARISNIADHVDFIILEDLYRLFTQSYEVNDDHIRSKISFKDTLDLSF